MEQTTTPTTTTTTTSTTANDEQQISRKSDKQPNKNTLYSNGTSKNFFKRYFSQYGESRPLEDIPPEQLNILVARSFKDATKPDGRLYEPDVLSTYFRGLYRHLEGEQYAVNILTDPSFELSRKVLAAKRKEIKEAGGGNKPNAIREITREEEDQLFETGYFDIDDPDTLRNAIWWLTSSNFGFLARHESRQLQWGDFELGYDPTKDLEYLECHIDRYAKSDVSKSKIAKQTRSPVVYASASPRCLVRYFKAYKDKRPPKALLPHSPLFLQTSRDRKSCYWYKETPLGVNGIAQIMTDMRKTEDDLKYQRITVYQNLDNDTTIHNKTTTCSNFNINEPAENLDVEEEPNSHAPLESLSSEQHLGEKGDIDVSYKMKFPAAKKGRR